MFEAFLLLASGYAAGKLTVLEFFWPFVRPGGGSLPHFLIYFFAALIFGILWMSKIRVREKIGFWIAVGCIGTVLIIAASRQLAYRSVESMPTTDNDGVIQSSAAARFLLQGENPYTADFRITPFRWFTSPYKPSVDNVALDHYAYLPLQFLFMVPTIWINDTFDTRFDLQLLFLVLFLGYSALVIWCGKNWQQRTRLLVMTAGNPWFWFLALAGFNDIMLVIFLVAAAIGIWKRWFLAAAVAFGLALASKQTAWIALPFWIALVYALDLGRYAMSSWKLVAIPLIVAAVTILPFFLWNPAAFFDDTVRFVGGSIPFSYPLSGNTVLQYLRHFGLVDSPWTLLPSWPFQLAIGIPMIMLGWKSLRQRPQPSRFLFWTSLTIMAIIMFSRFAPDNYFLMIAEIVAAAYGLSLTETHEAQPS